MEFGSHGYGFFTLGLQSCQLSDYLKGSLDKEKIRESDGRK